MAEADLDDLESEYDELTLKFNNAADHLKSLVSNIDNNTLLTLYGYYKQGSEGPCTIAKPSWYDTKGKAKWTAWNKLGNLSPSEAKLCYIKLIQNIDPTYDAQTSSNRQGWVCVSTLQVQNEPILDDSEKSLTDFVKEGNLKEVKTMLKSYNRSEVIELLNKLDEDGLSVIHWAADRGSSDMLDTIISFGADVNLTDADFQTAMHYASSCGHIECISVLLKNGADLSLKDADGFDPRAVANDDSIRKLLDGYS